VRMIPQACASLHRCEWNRNKFTGCQLNGKKLLIIGLGRIGSNIAVRARAFGMEVMAYDPYITQKRADNLRVELIQSLEDAISTADVVTIHTPLTKETKNMINEDMLRVFKPGAYLINCARGGIVDEKAVTDAIRENRLAGFGTDVYASEPLTPEHPYLAEDITNRIIITPHIGANTHEAQSEVSRIAVENMLAVLRNQPYEHAVNLPFMEQNLSKEQKMYLILAEKLGTLSAKLAEARHEAINNVHLKLRGELFDSEDYMPQSGQFRPYTIAALKGILEISLGESINYMLAPILIKDRHISVDESTGESKTYKNTIEIDLETEKGKINLMATITEEGRQRIVMVNDYWVDFVPTGKLLIFQNHDRPGVIGKIGNLLGEAGVNIANFALGRKEGSGLALGALEIDGDTDEKLMKRLIQNADFVWGFTIDFSECR
ncbi:MAG: NAD(P)-dependent oxidoreductase, partial [Synergistaceae bacterium]|nr:NAD(P)-dependent oxidoreductase [Synergistaceae bacterium]